MHIGPVSSLRPLLKKWLVCLYPAHWLQMPSWLSDPSAAFFQGNIKVPFIKLKKKGWCNMTIALKYSSYSAQNQLRQLFRAPHYRHQLRFCSGPYWHQTSDWKSTEFMSLHFKDLNENGKKQWTSEISLFFFLVSFSICHWLWTSF